jgi:UDP-N-acetylenolpyruvoylglucosamine reductase
MSATLEKPDVLANELTERVSSATVIRRDEPMAKHTTLRVGGSADLYVEPANEADLAAILKFCGERGLKFFILGRGSNLIVRDGGFRGVVICLSSPEFSRIEIDGTRIGAGAGAKSKELAVAAKRVGLSGVEFLEGIPGSIGGALRMNAGAMGGETFNAVETVRVMDFAGNIRELTPSEMSVSYRSCATLKNHIALAAVFRCTPTPREEIQARMKAFSEKRWSSQPAAPSAGCMFKNPTAIPAGKLIDNLGLKGTKIGGARVSLEHGNFLVNDGSATAKDVLNLIEFLREKAKAAWGIDLVPEVEILGED